MKITIYRWPESLMFKRDPDAPDDWYNNDDHNSLDDLLLEDGGAVVFRCKAQTVSNIPGGRFLNTLGVGPFQLRLFVEPRQFYGRIHGVCEALTLWGQTVDGHSIASVAGKDGAPISFDRWLHARPAEAPAEPAVHRHAGRLVGGVHRDRRRRPRTVRRHGDGAGDEGGRPDRRDHPAGPGHGEGVAMAGFFDGASGRPASGWSRSSAWGRRSRSPGWDWRSARRTITPILVGAFLGYSTAMQGVSAIAEEGEGIERERTRVPRS